MGLGLSPLEFDTELQTLRERPVDRLLVADVFDGAAFDALLSYLNMKAGLLRSEQAISKHVLSCLRDAQQSIISRAEYVPAAKVNIEKAQSFAALLDLMIIGETLDDRVSGKPRVT